VAYRKLFGVAWLVCGILGAGCSNGKGRVAYDVDDDPPPASGDQPPVSPDRPNGNPDRPPNDSEQPPANSDAPSNSGQLQELCEKLCEVVDRCASQGNDMEGMDTRELCAQGSCMLPANVQIPCANELAGALDCVLGLSNLCAADGSEVNQANALECRDSVAAYSECSEGISSGGPEPEPEPSCTPAGRCRGCMDDCETCFCEIADDQTPDPMACTDECTP
jgi:hypothetical protein